MNEIILIDAFITNKLNEEKLKSFIEKIKIIDLPILLISNTVISEEIVNKVDYYIYDSENRLFEDIFEDYDEFILWETLNDIRFNTVYKHKQKHALSVMVNLFNGIMFAKSIGYKNFHRIEYDTILGDKTINFIKNIRKKTEKEEKKGYFFLNEKNKTQKFQYFYCNIDFFLKTIPLIKEQNHYMNLLIELYNSKKFVHIERVMYDLIKNNNSLIITFNDGEEINDSVWNTETSTVHIEDKFKNCRTNFYKGKEYDLILSKNNKEIDTKRIITLFENDDEVEILTHEISKINEFIFNKVDKNIDKITISENGKIIETIDTINEKNYFE